MSVDLLHDKIRKLKNPSVLDFKMKQAHIPPQFFAEEKSVLSAYQSYCEALMAALTDVLPAVRFSFGTFAMFGAEGLNVLEALLKKAKEHGYFVFLDGPEILSPWGADSAAEMILGDDRFVCDGLIVSPYIGSDGIKPFLSCVKDRQKSLFLLVHSANKSSAELQDLLSGTRHVYDAAAELVSRFGEQLLSKCGYSHVCAVTSACNAQQLQTLRVKHNRMFMLVDGLDYPSGNAKNCSYAFDRFGFGAAVCAGPLITTAWAEEDAKEDAIEAAKQAAERMKKNITRYVTVL